MHNNIQVGSYDVEVSYFRHWIKEHAKGVVGNCKCNSPIVWERSKNFATRKCSYCSLDMYILLIWYIVGKFGLLLEVSTIIVKYVMTNYICMVHW